MDYHQNARTTVWSRERMAEQVLQQGWTLQAAAAACNVSAKTAAKWVARYRQQGRAGLRIAAAARATCAGPPCRSRWRESKHCAASAGPVAASPAPPASVRLPSSRILRRLKLNRLRNLEPAPLPVRYEHAAPGDLVHLDIEKLGRFSAVGMRIHGDPSRRTRGLGWDYLHVAIDDHSRIAFAQILPRENGPWAAAFLGAALDYYNSLGIGVARLLTDNGPCYRSSLSPASAKNFTSNTAAPALTPRAPTARRNALSRPRSANGPMSCAYNTSGQRAQQLNPWLHDYNWHRPHASLNQQPPICRVGLDRNNLLMQHKNRDRGTLGPRE